MFLYLIFTKGVGDLVKSFMMMWKPDLIVIGGGLAGCEAAWQAAKYDCKVALYEMRPKIMTGAHVTSNLSELVCSNSLGSNLPDRASGLLKNELRILESLLIECADGTAVPAGGSLAVDRQLFSNLVTQRIEQCENIRVIRDEIVNIPETPTIIATGPLTSQRFSEAIKRITGKEHLFFFDAIAPIISHDSIDLNITYRASRYNKGEADYLNCPMAKDIYFSFVRELITAKKVELKFFELQVNNGVVAGKADYFEGCLPIEVLAKRDDLALAYGPMRPVGLKNPHTGLRPFAVVQLRQDNQAGSLYNMVGFQTNLVFPEQKRIFQMIPGLENAIFERYGQMHRNTYIFSPAMLYPTMQYKFRDDLFFAGQITGVEGYAGNIATGWLAGWNAARLLKGLAPLALPQLSMSGALCDYITQASEKDFQPMKANFGLLIKGRSEDREGIPSGRKNRLQRNMLLVDIAIEELTKFYQEQKG